LRYRGHWNLLGFGYWVIEEKATEAFVGEVGLSESKREMEPSIEGIPEAGWVLAPAHFGKGYATEAVAAVIEWSRAHLGALPLACIIAPDNAASLRVAKKCGFEERCQAKYRGTTVVQFMLDPGGNSEARSAEV
jgi:RimJ/RimL family protein N-acetyltransferase